MILTSWDLNQTKWLTFSQGGNRPSLQDTTHSNLHVKMILNLPVCEDFLIIVGMGNVLEDLKLGKVTASIQKIKMKKGAGQR